MRPAWVYTAWGYDGKPLYVGCTMNLRSRMKDHERWRPYWLTAVAWIAVVKFPTREEALNQEGVRIAKLRPAWNIRGNVGLWNALDYTEERLTWEAWLDAEGIAA